jgi:phage host-nuclease inhibitor protein Gam
MRTGTRKHPVMTSWDDVDLALRRIGLIQRRIEQAEGALTERVARLKEQSLARLAPLEAERGLLAQAVEDFARLNRAAMPGRSIELNHGRVGFRRATSVVVPEAAAALAALKRLGLTSCLRVKESLDMVALRALPGEVLSEIGARRQVAERFFYEVAREAVALAGRAA